MSTDDEVPQTPTAPDTHPTPAPAVPGDQERHDGYRTMVCQLIADGHLDQAWRNAFLSVPRYQFLPETIYTGSGTDWMPVNLIRHTASWWSLATSGSAIVTQLDDGREGGPGFPSCCSPMPMLVARMLDHLDIGRAKSVLEIGTGTGWSTGLLCARLGARNVASIEIDPMVAAEAEGRLHLAGLHPGVLTGDGEERTPRGRSFDRVASTVAVHKVPYTWVRAAAPGGLVVTPWATPLHNGVVLKLRVSEDGTRAAGHFADGMSFMWSRTQRFRPPNPGAGVVRRYTPSPVDPRQIFSAPAQFAVGLFVRARYSMDFQDGELWRYVLWNEHDSYARVITDGYGGSKGVLQAGPRDLWAEIVDAYEWWCEEGKPDIARFGMTVTAEGQTVWLDSPDNIVVASDGRPQI